MVALVRLRDVIEDDLPVFFENQRDAEAARMAAFTPREHDAFYAHWRGSILGRADVRARTIVLDGGVVAGHVASWPLEGRRLVGYWIGRPYWGRGIATAALREFLAHDETSRPLHAYVAVTNAASRRVLAKCGFLDRGETKTWPDGVVDLLVHLP